MTRPRGGGGLWIQSLNQAYDNDSRTQWVYSVPNYVMVKSAWMDGVWVHSSGTHMYAGIAYGSRWNGPVVNVYDDRLNDNLTVTATAPDHMNSFVMGLYEDCCWGAAVRPSIAWAGFNGINIKLGDGTPPWGVELRDFSPNLPVPTQVNEYGLNWGTKKWVSAQGSYTFKAFAGDSVSD